MITYANVFGLRGAGARQAVVKAVGTWTKRKLGNGLAPENLVREYFKRGQFERRDRSGFIDATLKIVTSNLEGVETVSWSLKHPDEQDVRRVWITEVGMRSTGELVEFSCVTRCDDAVPFPEATPYSTQPGVVGMVFRNVLTSPDISFDEGTVGFSPKVLRSTLDETTEFQYEVFRQDRRYPIVLISQPDEYSFWRDVAFIQLRLFGLAQVVEIPSSDDGLALRDMLGDRLSAWNGSINVIGAPGRSGRIWSQVAVLDEIETWGDDDAAIAKELLSRIASRTNLATLKRTIRPEGVLQDALRAAIRGSAAAGAEVTPQQMNDLRASYEAAAQEEREWIEALEKENADFSESIRDLRDALSQKNIEVSRLYLQLRSNKVGSELQKPVSYADLGVEIVRQLLAIQCGRLSPSPLEVLKIIEIAYGERVIILPSAWDSAEKSEEFGQGSQLLDLMVRLSTDWIDKVKVGGDSLAKNVFGANQYAAHESETIKNSARLRKYRTFEYNGRPIEMYSHLKIGVADDSRKTIRVHFHWDGAADRLVIGYCGPHLPLR